MKASLVTISRVNEYQFGIKTKDGQTLNLPSKVEVQNQIMSPSGNVEVLVLKLRVGLGGAWDYFGLIRVMSDGLKQQLSFHLSSIETSLIFGANTFVWEVTQVDDNGMLMLDIAYGSLSDSGLAMDYEYRGESVFLCTYPRTAEKRGQPATA